MKPYNQLWLPTIALVGALALAACGQAAATQPTQPAATAQPAPTSAPAATSAPPTAAPTSAPAATAVPQPTAEPTTSAGPSATPDPTSLLPNDAPWVQSAGTIFADDESFEFAKHGLPAPAYNFVTASDGTMVAYTSQQGHLIVADVRTGQAIVDDSQAIMPTNFVFSPDSGALAYGTGEGELKLIELPSGTRHPIALGHGRGSGRAGWRRRRRSAGRPMERACCTRWATAMKRATRGCTCSPSVCRPAHQAMDSSSNHIVTSGGATI